MPFSKIELSDCHRLLLALDRDSSCDQHHFSGLYCQTERQLRALWDSVEVVSDNSPQFASTEFRSFAAKYDFLHVTTSPFLPNANSEAERAVQSAKRILQQEDPWLSLLIYRDTVIAAVGYSPAQLMLGRHVRTTLPTLPSSLLPHWPNPDVVRQKDQETKSSYSRTRAILSECGQVNRPFGVRRAQWLPKLTHHVRTWSRQIRVSIGVADVIYRRLGRPSPSHDGICIC